MKIGISVATYYPGKDGVQFVTQNLAEGLVKRGHNVTVITGMFPKCEKETFINGVKVLRCNIKNKNMFHFGDKKGFQSKIVQLSKNMEIIIFVSLESVAADWALDILDDIKCQKMLYMHGMHRIQWKSIDFENIQSFCYKILKDIRWGVFYKFNKGKIKKFDKIIHLHRQDESFEYFEKRYPHKNYVLENFAEDMFFDDNQDIQSSDYYIYVANYFPRKNQKLLLEAFYLMKNNMKLIFVGNCNNKYYYSLIEKKKKMDLKYGVEKDIDFLYGIDRKDLPLLLRNAYAYVMTSRWEAFPITIAEAMASSIPYISTDVGIVKYIPGGLISTSKASDIAQKMDLLWENEEMYQALKKEASSYAKNKFDYNVYLSKFEEIAGIKTVEKRDE